MDKNTKTKAIIFGIIILLVGGIIGFLIHTPKIAHHKKLGHSKHVTHTATKKHVIALSNIEGNISSISGTTLTVNGTTIDTNKATKIFNGSSKISETSLSINQKVDVLDMHTKKGVIAKFILVI